MESNFSAIMPIRNPRTISFDNEYEEKGLYELLFSNVPMKMIGKNRYVVSDIHCSILQSKNIMYNVLDEK
jgi:hypothetical protein